MKALWRPIGELQDLYSCNLLIRAPELADPDVNEHGVSIGYYQDGEGWLAPAYDNADDFWFTAKVNPTHFLEFEGPEPFTEEEIEAANKAGLERYEHRMLLKQAGVIDP